MWLVLALCRIVVIINHILSWQRLLRQCGGFFVAISSPAAAILSSPLAFSSVARQVRRQKPSLIYPAMENFDGMYIKNDDGTKCDILRKPDCMDEQPLVNKSLYYFSHRLGSCHALGDVRSEISAVERR